MGDGIEGGTGGGLFSPEEVEQAARDYDTGQQLLRQTEMAKERSLDVQDQDPEEVAEFQNMIDQSPLTAEDRR